MADDGEPQRELHPSEAPIAFSATQILIGDRLPDSNYPSCEAVLQAYQSHAYDKGYSILFDDRRPNKEGSRVRYMCDRGRKPRDRKNHDLHESKKRPNAGSRKTNCPFKIIAQEQRDGTWRGYVSQEYHNHEASDGVIAHPSKRTPRLENNAEATALATSLLARATPDSTIRAQLRTNWQLEVTARDIYNLGHRIRIKQLGGKTPIQWLADELEQRQYFVRIDTDDNNRVTRLLAHPECSKLLKRFPDVILIVCTYKTNRFNMPLVNICGSSGNNMTPQFAIAFLSGEKEADYTWTLQAFQELLLQEVIPNPRCFVTDRELALLNTLDTLFPQSDHILCSWHVNMNVVTKTKKHFKTQEDFDEFYTAWLKVINSRTFGAYNNNLRDLKLLQPNAVKYVENTWLVWREKIVKYWVDKAAHFGNTKTSRNESSHAAIEGYLRKGTGDHKHFFDAICIFWEDQHRSIRDAIAQAKVKPRTATNIQLFQDVLGFVHSFALLKINAEKAKLPLKLSDPLPQPCLCTIQQCMGLPCFHMIWERQRNPGMLWLADIDPHWYYDCEALGPVAEHVERRILLTWSHEQEKARHQSGGEWYQEGAISVRALGF